MSDPSILIISTAADVATDAVVQALATTGVRCRRVNTEDLPFGQTLTVDYQSNRGPAAVFDGEAISPRVIWYRRVRAPGMPDTMDPGVYEFCIRETRATVLGGLLTQSARWMNRPDAVWQAELKLHQLHVAQAVGLRIPRTIVSNEAAAIRRAYDEFGSLIVKPARAGHLWQGGEEFAIYTSQVTAAHLEELDDAQWAPSIYQELVPKRVDLRITCVGRQLFGAAIHSQTEPMAKVDWRRTDNPQLPHSRFDIPEELKGQILALMHAFDLQFGCLDFVLTPTGEYVFLEVNPNGQWLWLDDQLQLGISEAVASWLADAARETEA